MSENELIIPYCTVAWAEQFFSEFTYSDVWNDASAEKKLSAVKSATHFINLFVNFYDKDGKPFYFVPDGTDDFDDEIIPRQLKTACAQEASYLLSLDDNPAEPHPLTILGMISADGKHFDKDYTPPIFPVGVVRLLLSLDAEIDPEAAGGDAINVSSLGTAY